MQHPVSISENLIYSAGTQVVSLKPVFSGQQRVAHPAGAVAVITKSPLDRAHAYRVRFSDGFETMLHHDQLRLLAKYQQGDLYDTSKGALPPALFQRVLLRCVIGSRAYGLEHEHSDIDCRGIYLPTAAQHWSLYGVPEQIENDATQEAYWELQKFLVLALKANPNVLECLYTPLVEHATPLAQELLEHRALFVSQLVYQTYNGYVLSQFKKMQADLRNQGQVKWKHVMHLIRLLLSGITALREGIIPVHVGEQRAALLAIKAGEVAWADIEAWRIALHKEFDQAAQETKLPEKPDYAWANAFLVKARRLAIDEALP